MPVQKYEIYRVNQYLKFKGTVLKIHHRVKPCYAVFWKYSALFLNKKPQFLKIHFKVRNMNISFLIIQRSKGTAVV